jgi:TPR repeat protein
MKVKWCVTSFLLLALCAGIQLHAQQGDTNSVEGIKAKAESGDAQDQCVLAENLDPELPDIGTPAAKDLNKAIDWYLKSANQGNVEAQYNLGCIYFNGKYVPEDDAKALKWFRKAAEQGHASAEYNLGSMYANGKGVEKDSVEAAKWCRKAAEQGNVYAQKVLAGMYYNGRGVLVDYVQAVKWNTLASAQGNEEAVNFWVYVLSKEVPSEQIAEGQRLAREFVPRKETPGSNSNPSSPVAADSPIANGTGFFITDDGYLITNNHVVKDAAKIRLVTSAGTISAKVVQVDAANDIALLKAVGKFTPLPVAASRGVKLGGTVATIGFPNIGMQGFAPKLAKGEIASLSGAQDDARYFQISVPVQPGNSGGALVDDRGNVIGIVSAKLDASVALAASGALPENVNYAIKSSFLLGFLESVPDVSAKLKAPNTQDEKFEDVVKSAQQAAVLVLVY